MGKYTLGVDFGTLSGRGTLVDVESNRVVATATHMYEHGVFELELPSGKKLPPMYALMDAWDYINALRSISYECMERAQVSANEIVSIALDCTSCSMLPFKKDGTPLCNTNAFRDEPHAYVKIWKHHSAYKQASHITDVARRRKEGFLEYYGVISPEWMLPKLLETIEEAPDVFAQADFFAEVCDWLAFILTGKLYRNTGCVGFKSCYQQSLGYPSMDFLREVHPMLETVFFDKLSAPLIRPGEKWGTICPWASKTLGLSEHTIVATPLADGNAPSLGLGIYQPGQIYMILGTSACIFALSEEVKPIEGIFGPVADGVVRGVSVYEAGQPSAGDTLDWFVNHAAPTDAIQSAKDAGVSIHNYLLEQGLKNPIGAHGLVCLDWFNGSRSPINDELLSGAIVGLTLQTRTEDIYLALCESMIFEGKLILERFVEGGVRYEDIIITGGIPNKNPILMQLYADILGHRVLVPIQEEMASYSMAINAAVASGVFANEATASRDMGAKFFQEYIPNMDRSRAYDKLYRAYCALHEYFSKESRLMKELRTLRLEGTC